MYEANLQLNKQAVYWKYEFVQKSSEELDLQTEFGERNFNINAGTVGYNQTICKSSYFQLAAGAQATINFSPRALHTLYGKTPLGGELYLQMKPRIHGRQ